MNECNKLDLIVLYWISLIQWFLMVLIFIKFSFNLSISPETVFPLQPLEVNIIHNQMLWSLKMEFPLRGHSILLMSPMKRNCSTTSTYKKARNVTLPTNACSPSPFSKGDGNQSHPEHNKREVSSFLIAKEAWKFNGR